MSKQTLAIALCRVSSIEQLENNSLNRQKDSVLKAAEELGVEIPENGWWSGSVSSKRGTNIYRKDLQEMLERCKKEKHIKYVIVDEPDRFMRSIDEAAYFEVSFSTLGVKVWYASDPELNKGDLASKLLKFTKYLSAEGSNEERQRKSIAGQTKAIAEGRFPFSPKPGYKRGYARGVQDIHETRGPALQLVLTRIANHSVTPSQALVELNKSDFMKNHAPYKMDKFRKIATDPFYAGIVEINKQVNIRNENGLHKPLITKEQHLEIVRIINSKGKNQAGPRKNGNPHYPLSNLITCEPCKEIRNGRVVGFPHGNGKNKVLVYEKYRCRSCGRYIYREELHKALEDLFRQTILTKQSHDDLMEALEIVWKQKEGESQQESIRIQRKIVSIQESISNQVEAATEPSNAAIKEDILKSISLKKESIKKLEDELDSLARLADKDRERFLRFAFGFITNTSDKFFEASKENRLRCKQLVFPGGFYWNKENKVYTPQLSSLYRLSSNKKDLPKLEKSLLVRVQGL